MSNQGKAGHSQTLNNYQRLTEYQIASVSRLNDVIFKDKASATAGKKFTSLFPGLGYAAGYKVRARSNLECLSYRTPTLTGMTDSPKDIQVRRPTICARLSSPSLRRFL